MQPVSFRLSGKAIFSRKFLPGLMFCRQDGLSESQGSRITFGPPPPMQEARAKGLINDFIRFISKGGHREESRCTNSLPAAPQAGAMETSLLTGSSEAAGWQGAFCRGEKYVQTKPTAFFLLPIVAKIACGFAHKQTLCWVASSSWLQQEKTWKVFLTSLLNTHTHPAGEEFQGSPGVRISAKSSFTCYDGKKTEKGTR